MPPSHAILTDGMTKFAFFAGLAGVAAAGFWNSFLDKTVQKPPEFQTEGGKEVEK